MRKSMAPLLGLVAAVAIFTTFSAAAAHDENPDSNKWKVTSVHWVKKCQNDLDKDNKFVALVGKVTKQLNGDSYEFNDGTGTIRLDSDIKLPVGKQIVVRGEIDQAFLHIGPLEIDVESWRPAAKTGLILTK